MVGGGGELCVKDVADGLDQSYLLAPAAAEGEVGDEEERIRLSRSQCNTDAIMSLSEYVAPREED